MEKPPATTMTMTAMTKPRTTVKRRRFPIQKQRKVFQWSIRASEKGLGRVHKGCIFIPRLGRFGGASKAPDNMIKLTTTLRKNKIQSSSELADLPKLLYSTKLGLQEHPLASPRCESLALSTNDLFALYGKGQTDLAGRIRVNHILYYELHYRISGEIFGHFQYSQQFYIFDTKLWESMFKEW